MAGTTTFARSAMVMMMTTTPNRYIQCAPVSAMPVLIFPSPVCEKTCLGRLCVRGPRGERGVRGAPHMPHGEHRRELLVPVDHRRKNPRVLVPVLLRTPRRVRREHEARSLAQ